MTLFGVYCPTCAAECLPVNGRCGWCDTIIVKAFSRDPISDCCASPGLPVRLGTFRSKQAAELERKRAAAEHGVLAYRDGTTVYVVAGKVAA